jgi:hypothetical protein
MHTLTEVLLALFLALGCAWLVVDLARKLRQPGVEFTPSVPAPSTPAPASVTDSVPAATAPETPPVSGIPATHFAAIAAAVHHLFQGRARLSSVVSTGGGGAHLQIDWAREGRRDIFTSHRVR